ncbi:hypothetical protein B0T26DRAFT_874297 [Lasiosphaeria miniovina]|uniref:FHA domain-containing protein n=1 Tax=Lasiosphaeria miniovina TaxID=1954250 RepID=A0AA40A4H5_9PEZI|nr:uncharacterized protein B0T26DRAFT_874297 [Lasiosphaeria miniovina]KAK0709148.1 hypothetical protein B0T26DRAFT_874297 [Lasiosphaeria miniovina]
MCDEPPWARPGFGVFYLRPLNDRAQAAIENPKNTVHVRLSRTNERVLSVGHVRSTRGEHRTTLITIGRDADIVVDGCSIAKIQCSFEIDIEKGLVVFYDRSHLQTSNILGPCATPFQSGSPRNTPLLAGTDTIIGMGGPQSTHVMFELVWYDDRYRTVVSHLYDLHMKDEQRLSRMPTINDAADKTLLSKREVEFLENESVSKEQRRLENRKWHLIWRHQASFPANQFKAEVKAELDNPEIRQEANRSCLDLEVVAADYVRRSWIKEGIWDYCRDESKVWRWRHEEIPDLGLAKATETIPFTLFTFRWLSEEDLVANSAVLRIIIHQWAEQDGAFLATPFYRFMYKVVTEIDHGQLREARQIRRTYEDVKAAWERRGIWSPDWGPVPGLAWTHEQPLDEYLAHEMAKYDSDEMDRSAGSHRISAHRASSPRRPFVWGVVTPSDDGKAMSLFVPGDDPVSPAPDSKRNLLSPDRLKDRSVQKFVLSQIHQAKVSKPAAGGAAPGPRKSRFLGRIIKVPAPASEQDPEQVATTPENRKTQEFEPKAFVPLLDMSAEGRVYCAAVASATWAKVALVADRISAADKSAAAILRILMEQPMEVDCHYPISTDEAQQILSAGRRLASKLVKLMSEPVRISVTRRMAPIEAAYLEASLDAMRKKRVATRSQAAILRAQAVTVNNVVVGVAPPDCFDQQAAAATNLCKRATVRCVEERVKKNVEAILRMATSFICTHDPQFAGLLAETTSKTATTNDSARTLQLQASDLWLGQIQAALQAEAAAEVDSTDIHTATDTNLGIYPSLYHHHQQALAKKPTRRSSRILIASRKHTRSAPSAAAPPKGGARTGGDGPAAKRLRADLCSHLIPQILAATAVRRRRDRDGEVAQLAATAAAAAEDDRASAAGVCCCHSCRAEAEKRLP